MKIRIPNQFMGKPIAGAMERVLAGAPNPEQETPSQAGVPPQTINGFEYVPSIKLYVAKQKELHNNNWNQCQTALHQRGDRMPTPYEFVEFIKHLRVINTDEARAVLDEIYTVRSPWRSEWLDARFEGDTMKYHIFGSKGIEEKTQSLAGVLKEDKTPGIDIDSWLKDNTYGLPKSGIKKGDLCYWHPCDGKVAGFSADSDGTGLGCGRGSYCRGSLARGTFRAQKNLGA